MRYLFLLMSAVLFLLSLPVFPQDPAPETPTPAVEVVEEPVTVIVTPEVLEVAPDPEEVPVAEVLEAVPMPDEDQVSNSEKDLETQDEVLSTVNMLIDAAKRGDYLLAVSCALMLVVWVFRTYLWTTMKKEWIPYATVGLTTIAGFAGTAIAGGSLTSSLVVAATGLLTGLAAVGVWETLGKKMLKKPTGK